PGGGANRAAVVPRPLSSATTALSELSSVPAPTGLVYTGAGVCGSRPRNGLSGPCAEVRPPAPIAGRHTRLSFACPLLTVSAVTDVVVPGAPLGRHNAGWSNGA